MFRAVLSDVDLLKNSIPIISEIIDEGVFRADENGLTLMSADRTMVAVVDFKILSTAFDEFKVEGKPTLGLNMTSFVAILRRAKSGDKMIMEVGEKNRLKITLKNGRIRSFEIPLLDITTDKPPIDQLSFTGKVDVDSQVLEEGIADADVIGDSVFMEATPEQFSMYAKGDVSSARLDLSKEDKGLLKIGVGGTIRSQYPLEYLKKMIKASKLASNLSLEFGADYPLRLSFIATDKLQLSFVLAPRVSEE
ncbi:MAG: proliferating cell nuclear antigen (pcna) [Nanoarchaeota archaeon]|nr:proliferating cell nuclear antigen (pcna) [Nanoarchaeota archaeon]